jgi:hypothetical protein
MAGKVVVLARKPEDVFMCVLSVSFAPWGE